MIQRFQDGDNRHIVESPCLLLDDVDLIFCFWVSVLFFLGVWYLFFGVVVAVKKMNEFSNGHHVLLNGNKHVMSPFLP
jgi:hypothetical protein